MISTSDYTVEKKWERSRRVFVFEPRIACVCVRIFTPIFYNESEKTKKIY